MTQNDVTMLAQVYNALLTISTCGEDTITMANCILALKPIVEKAQQDIKNQDEKE